MLAVSLWFALPSPPVSAHPVVRRVGSDRARSFVERNGWLYYSSLNDSERLCRIRPDGSQREVLADLPHATLLGFDGDAVYFGVSFFETGAKMDPTIDQIHRLPREGAAAEKVADVSIAAGMPSFAASGRHLFFNGRNGRQTAAMRLDMDAGKLDALSQSPIQIVRLADKGHVFFALAGKDGGIFRATPESPGCNRILEEPVQEFVVEGNWIFFASATDLAPGPDPRRGRLYRVPVAGGVPERIDGGGSSSIHVSNGWLYFSQDKNGPLRRSRVDGSDSGLLHPGELHWPLLASDWIYFTSGNPMDAANCNLCRIRPDGSGRQILGKARGRFVAAGADWACYVAIGNNSLHFISNLAAAPPHKETGATP